MNAQPDYFAFAAETARDNGLRAQLAELKDRLHRINSGEIQGRDFEVAGLTHRILNLEIKLNPRLSRRVAL